MKIRESKGGVKIEKNKIFVYFAHSIAFIDPTRLRRLSDTNSYYSARRALRPILLCEACCPAWGGWRLLYELCIVRLIDRVKRKNTEARRRRRKYRYGRLFYSQRKKLKALLSSCSRAYRMRRGMSSRATPCSRRCQLRSGGDGRRGKLGIFPLSSGEKCGNPDVPRAIRHPGRHGLSGGYGDRCVRGVLSCAGGR